MLYWLGGCKSKTKNQDSNLYFIHNFILFYFCIKWEREWVMREDRLKLMLYIVEI
jgi:hypothetical protein